MGKATNITYYTCQESLFYLNMNNPKDFFRIGRVRISVTDEERAIQTIKDTIKRKEKGYVCISTMRTVAIANKDDCYQDVMENSLLMKDTSLINPLLN